MDAQPASSTHMSRTQSRLFPALGPALLICIGYIDPGKWAAIVDGGSRFGSDHLFLLAAFSCAAMLCQYLSARVGVVTGKNLAQVLNRPFSILFVDFCLTYLILFLYYTPYLFMSSCFHIHRFAVKSIISQSVFYWEFRQSYRGLFWT